MKEKILANIKTTPEVKAIDEETRALAEPFYKQISDLEIELEKIYFNGSARIDKFLRDAHGLNEEFECIHHNHETGDFFTHSADENGLPHH